MRPEDAIGTTSCARKWGVTRPHSCRRLLEDGIVLTESTSDERKGVKERIEMSNAEYARPEQACKECEGPGWGLGSEGGARQQGTLGGRGGVEEGKGEEQGLGQPHRDPLGRPSEPCRYIAVP